MSTTLPNLTLSSPEQTKTLAERIGAMLLSGDTLLLQGDIGAGKSFFARALIQSQQDAPEDVPSPTFTLVQIYETRLGEIWHSDLYRLNDPSEADELGLVDAFTSAICLIEWPDRLADLAPNSAITLTFQTLEQDDHRNISFSGGSEELRQRLSKAFK